MTLNPIRKVLSTLHTCNVQHLLMGGQACVLYGGAEFSRDVDITLAADPAQLRSLEAALAALRAECIAVPPLSADVLQRGHAVHFRCHHPEAGGIRLDVMSVMRGVDPFPALWSRRTTVDTEGSDRIEVIGLPDLVAAKKTRRDKDWLMIRRLLEAHHAQQAADPSPAQVLFWLREERDPDRLIAVAAAHVEAAKQVSATRRVVRAAMAGDRTGTAVALEEEERAERALDEEYWRPRIRELEQLRRALLRGPGAT